MKAAKSSISGVLGSQLWAAEGAESNGDLLPLLRDQLLRALHTAVYPAFIPAGYKNRFSSQLVTKIKVTLRTDIRMLYFHLFVSYSFFLSCHHDKKDYLKFLLAGLYKCSHLIFQTYFERSFLIRTVYVSTMGHFLL